MHQCAFTAAQALLAMKDANAAANEDAAYQRALAAGGQSRKLQQLTPEARADLDAAHGAAQANAASAGVRS